MTPQLLQDATGCLSLTAEIFAEPLTAACAFYHIDTPVRLAAFLAQISHESGALKWVREIWGPSRIQRGYEGRADLGNTEPGDGERFLGRGLIQHTGRHNYMKLRVRLRNRFPKLYVPDFEVYPERMEEPLWASLSAADYWDEHNLNALADAGEYIKIGRAINRGNAESIYPANGEEDRVARWERAIEAFA
jgi:putative chitinase